MSAHFPLPPGRDRRPARGWSARSRAAAGCLVLTIVGAPACGTDDAPHEKVGPAPRAIELTSGVVARVGTDEIAGASVARIAAAQKIDVASARDLAIRDALLAGEARAQALDVSPDTAFAMRTVLARRLLRTLIDDAHRAGPVTDDELREATERHWLNLDRPDGFRTIHAVVRVDLAADATKKERADALAGALVQAVQPAVEAARGAPAPAAVPGAAPPPDPAVEAFTRAAGAVPRDGLEVTIEPLPPVVADGRVLASGSAPLDPTFARAAASLARRGDLSPPVHTQFGVHVILLLERIPGVTLPIEERRRAVTEDVITLRAHGAQTKLLEDLRRGVSVDRSADAQLALVAIEP